MKLRITTTGALLQWPLSGQRRAWLAQKNPTILHRAGLNEWDNQGHGFIERHSSADCTHKALIRDSLMSDDLDVSTASGSTGEP